MADINVRAEWPSDFQAIDVINLSAFRSDTEAQMVTQLRETEGYESDLSLVAEYKGRLVGHVMLTRIYLEGEASPPILALAPMAVVPSQAYRGIGGVLLREAIDRARQKGFAAIVEVGQSQYYRRHGFKPLAEVGLRHSLALENEHLSILELRAGSLPKHGKLVFPTAFDLVVRQDLGPCSATESNGLPG